MNKIKSKKIIVLALVIVLPALLLIGGHTLAQQRLPATEPGGEVQEAMPPSYDSGDPAFQAPDIVPPDENSPSAAEGQALQFTYYQVAGATLRGRNSTTGYLYDGVGCSHVTSGVGTGMILNTELPIPDGSVIKYLRVYYNDTNPSNGVEGYITRYQPGQGTNDLVHAGSLDAFQGGFGFVVSQEITETVNNAPYIYTLIGWPDALGAANQICGLRVAYYAPFRAYAFMPSIYR